MDKPPDAPHDVHSDLTSANARSGLFLFVIYSAFYGVFVGVSAFSPQTMAEPTSLGPNVAIVYGFGLIVGALLLALVYMFLCQLNARRTAQEERK